MFNSNMMYVAVSTSKYIKSMPYIEMETSKYSKGSSQSIIK